MKPALAILIVFNLLGAKIIAGPPKKTQYDSLKKLIVPALIKQPAKANELNIDRINKLADKYFESFPDSTMYYGNMAVNLSKKINYTLGIADGCIQLASVYTFKGDYKNAADNLNHALNLYKQLHNNYGISEAYIGLGRLDDLSGNYDAAIKLYNAALYLRSKLNKLIDVANCYAIMGITYDNKGQFAKALDYDFKALAIDIQNKDSLAAADNYSNIGIIMQELALYPKAYSYHNKALDIWRRTGDRQGISTAYQNIGEVLTAQKKYKEAISYYRQAQTIFRAMDDAEGTSLMPNDFGFYYYHTNQPDSALFYFNLSISSSTPNKFSYNKAYAFLGLAMVYNQQTQYPKALDYALQAQAMANNLGSLNIKADAVLQISTAIGGLQRFKEAYIKNREYIELKDSLKIDENIQRLMAYNIELDFQKSNSDFKIRQQELERYYTQTVVFQKYNGTILSVVTLIMTILVVFYYLAKKKQQQINVLLTAKNVEVISQKTDLTIQADKLNELNILKDRLIGVLAHDLRAPLSTLHGLFALMTAKDINYQEFIEMAPGVFNKLESTSDFLDTLLFWINSQVDNIEQTAKSFSLCDLVDLELKMVDNLLAQKSLSIKNNVALSDIVLADPSSIRIVIHNLLTNAVKFSRKGTTIELATYPADEGYCIFMIRDQGIGMTETQLNSLFKSKVNSTLGTNNEIGTGMGLLFCKDLIEKYGGKIWAKSTKGESTELFFMLPAGGSVTEKILFIQ